MPAADGHHRVTAAELEIADQVGVELVRFMRAITRAKARMAQPGPDGIERLAYSVLFCLVHEGPQRTGKLAELLHAEISTISRQSRSLVAHGLVERRADPIDGRACVLAATDEGVRVFEANRQQRNLWLAGILADWPAGDRTTLTDLLARLNEGIESTPRETADQN
ncbi:putative MarR family transcriptional regulator [Nocardia brasiliensis NBRC 14402]|uniref:MarR family winged helix-turn-helix transcriptional regulator n=1 Tax=Nocardia brasiliensis TaxID=37326 RepID=UPI00030E9649|nr:MarR family transcriptional regulator [Nocardia brasiliensis]ASF08517.1 MarR family transcriptional regulator [Nocardia brasiliensis]GAJ85786.1 putative MarR family transcriptional regulator [Nocardia brasiliensis NBRC 14402]SUB40992.1 Predicted transcriptional regulator [Nocardia brasiliensis]